MISVLILTISTFNDRWLVGSLFPLLGKSFLILTVKAALSLELCSICFRNLQLLIAGILLSALLSCVLATLLASTGVELDLLTDFNWTMVYTNGSIRGCHIFVLEDA